MLQLLAYLTILIPLPIWALMIFGARRAITRQVTSNYMVFVILGILFVFLAVGLIAQGVGLNSLVTAALSTGGTDEASALSAVGSALPTLFWVVVGASSIMDLAGGYLIYRDTQRLGTPPLTAGALIAFTWLLGPLGMLIFALWRYLTEVRQAPTVPVVDHVTA